mgnify:CR=1 FL=1
MKNANTSNTMENYEYLILKNIHRNDNQNDSLTEKTNISDITFSNEPMRLYSFLLIDTSLFLFTNAVAVDLYTTSNPWNLRKISRQIQPPLIRMPSPSLLSFVWDLQEFCSLFTGNNWLTSRLLESRVNRVFVCLSQLEKGGLLVGCCIVPRQHFVLHSCYFARSLMRPCTSSSRVCFKLALWKRNWELT